MFLCVSQKALHPLYLLSVKILTCFNAHHDCDARYDQCYHLNFSHGLQLKLHHSVFVLHLPRRWWREWEAGAGFPSHSDCCTCLIVNLKPKRRKVAAPGESITNFSNMAPKHFGQAGWNFGPTAMLPTLYSDDKCLWRTTMSLLRYVLGTRKLTPKPQDWQKWK